MKSDLDNSTVLRFLGQRIAPVELSAGMSQKIGDGVYWEIQTRMPKNPILLNGQIVRPDSQSGQGFSLARSLRAAVAETMERLSATSQFPLAPRIMASVDQLMLRHQTFIALSDIDVYRDQQLDEKWRRRLSSNDVVPWIQGWQAKGDESIPTWLPQAKVILRRDTALPFFEPTTNGVAIGPNREFAIENAIAEILERGAFLNSWWLRRAPRHYRYSEYSHFLPPEFLDLTSWFHDRLVILDLSEYWGVPLFSSVFLGGSAKTDPGVVLGFGCGRDGRAAFLKAILEGYRVYRSYKWEKLKGELKTEFADPERTVVTFSDVGAFYANPSHRPYTEFLWQGSRGTRNDLEHSLDLKPPPLMRWLPERGHDLYLVDLTTLDLQQAGLSLIRAVVPDAVPLNSSFALRPWGCRPLRQVPWDQLNPYPAPVT